MYETIKLDFNKIETERTDSIAILTLSVPEKANALSKKMVSEIIQATTEIETNHNCRALIIRGSSKHFSAGADLQWMKESISLNERQNLEEAQELASMFEKIYRLKKPTLAIIEGAAYGGALGMICACDISFASEEASFCLSEIKLGLIPAVILPYLARKINPGSLRRLSLTGKKFESKYAKEIGLIEHTCNKSNLESSVREELQYILTSGPDAIAALKTIHQSIEDNSRKQSDTTSKAIAKVRTQDEAQAGLKSFFTKNKPYWMLTLPEKWTFSE